MKRLLSILVMAIACALCAQHAALALTEYCPAGLSYAAVGSAQEKAPAALYGFALNALGPRTISTATLAFDTSAGWYTMGLANVPLQEKKRHYLGSSHMFTHIDYASPIMYARFTQPLTVYNAWVYSAAAQNDGPFGWQALGEVACDPSPAPWRGLTQKAPRGDGPQIQIDPKDAYNLSAPPSASSLLLSAIASKPLENAKCTEPFRNATANHIAQADFPEVAIDDGYGIGYSGVEVAIDGDGTVRDAWIVAPSGYSAYDQEAVLAAKASTYIGARSYCHAIPGEYVFWVTFYPPTLREGRPK